MVTNNTANTAPPPNTYSLVLFDGVCRFCNGWVQFIIKHDKHDVFRFTPIQSEFALRLLKANHREQPPLDSVILIEGNKVYTHSSAVLHIFKRLGGGWRLLSVFTAVPAPLRDAIYRVVAKHRYRLFGKYESCMIPTASVRRKFIE